MTATTATMAKMATMTPNSKDAASGDEVMRTPNDDDDNKDNGG
jgi:hypothetical protein